MPKENSSHIIIRTNPPQTNHRILDKERVPLYTQLREAGRNSAMEPDNPLLKGIPPQARANAAEVTLDRPHHLDAAQVGPKSDEYGCFWFDVSDACEEADKNRADANRAFELLQKRGDFHVFLDPNSAPLEKPVKKEKVAAKASPEASAEPETKSSKK